MAMSQRDETIEEIKRLDASLEYAVMHDDNVDGAVSPWQIYDQADGRGFLAKEKVRNRLQKFNAIFTSNERICFK